MFPEVYYVKGNTPVQQSTIRFGSIAVLATVLAEKN
jgi:hypothetical protein